MFTALFLLFPLLWSSGTCQEISNITEGNSTDLVNPSYNDYILKLSFELDEDQVPFYIVRIIYNVSSPDFITTDDVLNLYNLKDITLTQMEIALNALNISCSKILSLDGLDAFLKEFNVSFPDFYNKVVLNRLGVSGTAARDFLVALSINTSEFSNGMTFGSPDPYAEFKKGNFSKESLQAALAIVGKTPEDLFEASKNEFVLKINATPRRVVIKLLNKYTFEENSAVELWNVLNLSMDNIRQIPAFAGIINNVTSKLNSTSVLGLLTGRYEAVVNSLVYDLWKEEGIVKVFGDTFSNKSKVQVWSVINQAFWQNLVKLSLRNMNISSEDVVYAESYSVLADTLFDCVFVSLENGILISEIIPEVHFHGDYVHINISTTKSEITLGSPLICQNKVSGLAKSLNGSSVLLDSFYIQSSKPSGSAEPSSSNTVYKLVLILVVSYIFWTDK